MFLTEQIKNVLENFSFSKDEADVYVAALSLERSSISKIARKILKSRTATDFHIQKLLERGFLRKVKRGRTKLIAPVPPRELLEQIHEKTASLENLLPQLEALGRIHTESPHFMVHESREGYWNVYDEISHLPKGSMFRILEGSKAVENELPLLMPHQWERFWQRIIERNIQTNALFTQELLNTVNGMISTSHRELLSKRVWNIRTLPHSALPVAQLMILYTDKAAFLFPETALVLVIEHKGVVSILKSMFDSLYSFARPVREPWQKNTYVEYG